MEYWDREVFDSDSVKSDGTKHPDKSAGTRHVITYFPLLKRSCGRTELVRFYSTL